MKILAKVKPGAKNNGVEKIGENEYLISTSALAQQGKANRAVVKLLAEHFKVSQDRISIVVGHKTKSKIIEIN